MIAKGRGVLIAQLSVAGLAVVSGLVYLVATIGEPSPGDELERFARQQMEKRKAKQAMATPQVRMGTPVAGEGLDVARVLDRIEPELGRINDCYGGSFEGRIDVRFDIGEDGRVVWANADGTMAADVNECVAAVVRSLDFPRPDGARMVSVSVPFLYTPG